MCPELAGSDVVCIEFQRSRVLSSPVQISDVAWIKFQASGIASMDSEVPDVD